MTLIDYCVIIAMALGNVIFAIWTESESRKTKRRIKALEDAQRESHEPGYWAGK